ncbi:MAG: (Na+)-NQR maturation NqrM [Pseudomonadales bacterium]|nr:(Na+)-NQR maturation NqrM [Pseudomonadales bacterium]
MLEFVLALALFLLLVGAMSIGVLLGRKPLTGSCGGMAALGMKLGCEICGGDVRKCESYEGGAPPSEAPTKSGVDALRLGR